MISLFVDASLSYCNLAIIENNKVLRHISIKTNNNLTDLIVEHIDKLLNSARLHQKDVKRLLIVIGPGSFTGIRVASTIAKTWNFVYQTPVYIINSLWLQLLTNDGISLIDAKGGNWYVSGFKNNKLIIKPQMLNENSLKSILSKHQELKIYKDYNNVDIFKNLLKHIDDFKLIKDIHKLTPLYIKKAL